ncbi:hypothetical protein B0H15DRAFT_588766 [Mycena belliarum]|uniref:Secreted protein n=1 Tax=Mycena belliarum TaxID=1033014 RepID=A0AAD6UH70_9AGAR|nr:hypothetical protein B0H15DRAFT_588766 [Mycena belliae]
MLSVLYRFVAGLVWHLIGLVANQPERNTVSRRFLSLNNLNPSYWVWLPLESIAQSCKLSATSVHLHHSPSTR